jgi:hypothetical protein
VHTRLWWGDLKKGGHLGDQDVGGKIIIKWILKRCEGAWTGLRWLRIEASGGIFKYATELPVSIKFGEFLD